MQLHLYLCEFILSGIVQPCSPWWRFPPWVPKFEQRALNHALKPGPYQIIRQRRESQKDREWHEWARERPQLNHRRWWGPGAEGKGRGERGEETWKRKEKTRIMKTSLHTTVEEEYWGLPTSQSHVPYEGKKKLIPPWAPEERAYSQYES